MVENDIRIKAVRNNEAKDLLKIGRETFYKAFGPLINTLKKT